MRWALTIGLGAALLFVLELLVARRLLPWYGGAAEVWSLCTLFFQVALVAGYALADRLARLSPRRQVAGLGGLVALAGAALVVQARAWGHPLLAGEAWRPEVAAPWLPLLATLAASAGLPFLVLAAAGPLLQHWAARARGAPPFWLYAASNAGSLLGLLAYPLVLERALDLPTQAWAWAAGFALFALGLAACARRAPAPARADPVVSRGPLPAAWLLLSACASALSLAATHELSFEVAAAPFFWVAPLAIYLGTLALTFAGERWAQPRLAGALLLAGAGLSAAWVRSGDAALPQQALALGLSVAGGCWVCHGALYALRPAPEQLGGTSAELTRFYLAVSVGGALGSAVVALGAPLAPGLVEYPLCLGAALLVLAWRHGRQPSLVAGAALLAGVLLAGRGEELLGTTSLASGPARALAWLGGAALAGLLVWAGRRAPQRTGQALGLGALLLTAGMLWDQHQAGAQAVRVLRGFYGLVRVELESPEEPDRAARRLLSGRITHGLQPLDPARRDLPNTYFGPRSGIGLALAHHPARARGLRVGVVGLGAGTLAAWGRPGDHFRFFELNPDMVRVAKEEFTFLADSPAEVEVLTGDGRLLLGREAGEPYDLLALDAFSGDAVPVHLLTREAFAVYARRLRPDGVLAVQTTNRHFDLAPVVVRLGRELGLSARVVDAPLKKLESWPCTWVLLARPETLAALEASAGPLGSGAALPEAPLWSDERVDLLGALARP